MRWHELFADLEGQARAAEAAERDSEVADRTRAELAQITVMARLYAYVGSQVRLQVVGAGDVTGRLMRVGADWVLLVTPDETVVAAAAIGAVVNLGAGATAPEAISAVAARTHLTAVLRAMARDRSTIVICLRQGGTFVGTPDRVGADWVDLAIHEESQAPRRSAVQGRMTVVFTSLATIRRGRSWWD
jgi:hypothetical protein